MKVETWLVGTNTRPNSGLVAYAVGDYFCPAIDCSFLKFVCMAAMREMEDMVDAVLKLRDLGRNVKVDLKISRKMGLLLAMAVEQGLLWTDPENVMVGIVSVEDRVQLQELATEILKKAEAEEFYGLVKKLAKG